MNRFRCEVCGKENASIFNCNYCGGYFCTEHHLPEKHNCPNKPPPKNEAITNSENSICVECKTKLNDDTLKHVTDCPYCQRPMCKYHLRPKPSFIPDFKDAGKRCKEIKEIIEKESYTDGGHPCFPYTKVFWERYDKQQEEYKKQLELLVHKPIFLNKKEEELEKVTYELPTKKLCEHRRIHRGIQIRKGVLIADTIFWGFAIFMSYATYKLATVDYGRFYSGWKPWFFTLVIAVIFYAIAFVLMSHIKK